MSIEKREKTDRKNLSEEFKKSLRILIDNGFDYHAANALLDECRNKFDYEDIEVFLYPALEEYLGQNPVQGQPLDRKDIELIEDKLAKIIEAKISRSIGSQAKKIYTSPGGVNITENSNN